MTWRLRIRRRRRPHLETPQGRRHADRRRDLLRASSPTKASAAALIAAVDITERKRAEARIAFMAHHDALTALPNRMLLRLRMEEMLGRLRRSGRQLRGALPRPRQLQDGQRHARPSGRRRAAARRRDAAARGAARAGHRRPARRRRVRHPAVRRGQARARSARWPAR